MEDNENFDPKDFLLFGLNHFEIEVLQVDGNLVRLIKGYVIEIEGSQLYKLKHEDSVIAPFNDVEELCNFIKQDMQLNE